MGIALIPMHSTPYVLAHLLVQLKHAEAEITKIEKMPVAEADQKLSVTGSSVRCATAEVFLLLINTSKYPADNDNWSAEHRCLSDFMVQMGPPKSSSFLKKKYQQTAKEFQDLFGKGAKVSAEIF